MKERYLHYKKTGDQYLGGVVTGLSCSNERFAVSPPYFDMSSTPDPQAAQKEIDLFVVSHLVNGSKVNSRVFLIFRMLFASLCFHSEFLKTALHQKNKLHASPLFNRIPRWIKLLAVVAYPWNCTEFTPVFTGIPPHVALLSKMEGLKEDFLKMKIELMNEFKEELDKRVNNGERHFDSKALMNKFETLEKTIVEKLNQKVKFVSTSNDPLLDCDLMDHNHDVAADNTTICFEENEKVKFNLFFTKGGKMTRVPENFVFPTMGLNLLITNWFCGDSSKRLIPLSLLSRNDLNSFTQKDLFSKMKRLMKLIETAAKREGCWKSKTELSGNVERCNQLYEKIRKYFEYPTRRHTRRYEQLCWTTYLNHYKKAKVFAIDL